MPLARFMATPAGRIARIVLGIALIVLGFVLGGGWIALAVIGVVPILAGAANLCLIAPILKAPFKGRDALQGR